MNDFIDNPQDVTFEAQGKGETIVLLLRKHFITNTGWIIITIVLAFIPLLVISGIFNFNFVFSITGKEVTALTIIWYLFLFGYAFQQFLIWYFNIYIVTNQRIVDVDFYQLLYKRVSAAELEEIQDVTFTMGGVAQATFNYGDVMIQTAAETEQFEFEKVPKPAIVQKTILDLAKSNGNV